MDTPASEWDPIPGDGLDRLRWWQRRRAAEEERERVIAALLKAPKERTDQENAIVAYSRFGTAAGCNHG